MNCLSREPRGSSVVQLSEMSPPRDDGEFHQRGRRIPMGRERRSEQASERAGARLYYNAAPRHAQVKLFKINWPLFGDE
jgi:hypothetical protein